MARFSHAFATTHPTCLNWVLTETDVSPGGLAAYGNSPVCFIVRN